MTVSMTMMIYDLFQRTINNNHTYTDDDYYDYCYDDDNRLCVP